jgi:hypothetical protein
MSRLTSRPTRRPSRVAGALAGLGLAVAALTGCGTQDRLGSAAVVDGHQITTGEVQTAAQEYLEKVPDADSTTVQRAILERMILSRIISAEAAKLGVHASPAAVARERADLLASVGGRDGLIRQLAAGQSPVVLAPSYVDRWFKDQVLYRRIAEKLAVGGDSRSPETANAAAKELIATGRAMDIQVNPRYGTWHTRTGISPLVSGGLARSADQING